MTKEEAAFLYSFDPGLACVIQDKKDGFTAGWEACEKVMSPARRPYDLKRKCRHFWSREDICETCGIHLAEATR